MQEPCPFLAQGRHSVSGSFYYDCLSFKITNFNLFLAILSNYGALRLLTHFTQKVLVYNELLLTMKIDGFHFVSFGLTLFLSPFLIPPHFLSVPLPFLPLSFLSVLPSLPLLSQLYYFSCICFPTALSPPLFHSGFICYLSHQLFFSYNELWTQPNCSVLEKFVSSS